MLRQGVRSARIPARVRANRRNERFGQHLERLGLFVRDDFAFSDARC